MSATDPTPPPFAPTKVNPNDVSNPPEADDGAKPLAFGVLIAIVGAFTTFAFLFVYDSSVHVSGEVERVNNGGMEVNRILGTIVGLALFLVGWLIIIANWIVDRIADRAGAAIATPRH